jgi:hypothetical protein
MGQVELQCTFVGSRGTRPAPGRTVERRDATVSFGDEFDQLKDKETLGQHGDKVEQGVDKAHESADEKTNGKYSDKLDKGADAGKGRFTNQDQQP